MSKIIIFALILLALSACGDGIDRWLCRTAQLDTPTCKQHRSF